MIGTRRRGGSDETVIVSRRRGFFRRGRGRCTRPHGSVVIFTRNGDSFYGKTTIEPLRSLARRDANGLMDRERERSPHGVVLEETRSGKTSHRRFRNNRYLHIGTWRWGTPAELSTHDRVVLIGIFGELISKMPDSDLFVSKKGAKRQPPFFGAVSSHLSARLRRSTEGMPARRSSEVAVSGFTFTVTSQDGPTSPKRERERERCAITALYLFYVSNDKGTFSNYSPSRCIS